MKQQKCFAILWLFIALLLLENAHSFTNPISLRKTKANKAALLATSPLDSTNVDTTLQKLRTLIESELRDEKDAEIAAVKNDLAALQEFTQKSLATTHEAKLAAIKQATEEVKARYEEKYQQSTTAIKDIVDDSAKVKGKVHAPVATINLPPNWNPAYAAKSSSRSQTSRWSEDELNRYRIQLSTSIAQGGGGGAIPAVHPSYEERQDKSPLSRWVTDEASRLAKTKAEGSITAASQSSTPPGSSSSSGSSSSASVAQLEAELAEVRAYLQDHLVKTLEERNRLAAAASGAAAPAAPSTAATSPADLAQLRALYSDLLVSSHQSQLAAAKRAEQDTKAKYQEEIARLQGEVDRLTSGGSGIGSGSDNSGSSGSNRRDIMSIIKAGETSTATATATASNEAIPTIPTGGARLAPAASLEVEPYHDLAHLPLNTYSAKAPHTGHVIGVKRLVGPSAPGEVCHILIDHHGKMPYWEGQSYGIVPPGTNPKNGKPYTNRLYSISSTRYGDRMDGQTVSLCVRRAIYIDPGTSVEDPAKAGVCSNYLCDAKPGTALSMTGPAGKTMLMPESTPGADLIMVATGTGVAPYRAFLRRLFVEDTPAGANFKGLAWLLLGVANTDALLYDDEFQAIQAVHPDQFRLTYALSREQQNRGGGKMYIQDRMEEHAGEIFDRLQGGAHIYFCGLKGMMPGIQDMLERVAEQRGIDWKGKMAELKKNKQWHVEVY